MQFPYRLRVLFEFDRIIGKDGIEIFLSVPRKLKIVLV
jgi:hypothetical protein